MKKSILTLCLVFLVQTHAYADSGDLKRQVRFYLPDEITTVGEAAQYFLEPYHYKLKTNLYAPMKARAISNSKLNGPFPLDRVMTVEDALLAITNDETVVIIDTKNKYVSFGDLVDEIKFEQAQKGHKQ